MARKKAPEFGILHVEDSEDILASFGLLLELEGYRVDQVRSLRELKTFVDYPKKIDGVNAAVVDGELPDGTGEKAAALIRNRNPRLPVIAFAIDEQKFGDVNLLKGRGPGELLAALKRIRRH